MRSIRSKPRWIGKAWRAVGVLGLLAIALVPSLPPHGPVLLEVVTPEPGLRIGFGGFELLVQFREGVAVEGSFRALLNGADVTDQLTTGENGSQGHLVDLLPGDNCLRLEISGRIPWARDRLFEQSRELHIWMQPPLDLDQG